MQIYGNVKSLGYQYCQIYSRYVTIVTYLYESTKVDQDKYWSRNCNWKSNYFQTSILILRIFEEKSKK